MANLTLVIDDDVLRAARTRAAYEDTSVNAVAREAINKYAQGSPFGSPERDKALQALFSLRASSRGRTWNREDIYG
jgi:plasmid stability protein